MTSVSRVDPAALVQEAQGYRDEACTSSGPEEREAETSTHTRSELLLGLVFTPARPAIHAFDESPENRLDQPGYEHSGDPTGHEYKNVHHQASPNKVCGSRIRQYVV